MKKILKLFMVFLFALIVCAFIQINFVNTVFASSEINFDKSNFPDDRFMDAIETECPSYTKDNILTLDEISKITSLDVSESGITNLKGIEYFINLKYLNISVNNLKNLDLSNNEQLITLEASNNQLLENLKLPQNIENVYINYNYSLKNFDITNYKKIKVFYASDVKLNNINLANLESLVALDVSNTNLIEIDVSKNINLEYLNISYNNLTQLNLQNNVNLVTVDAIYNKLNEILLPNSIKKDTSIDFLNQQVEEGYEVIWYENDVLISESTKVILQGQMLTSKINPKTYNIVFNPNGGKGTTQTQSIKFNETKNLVKNNFSKLGYTFAGWSLYSNSTNINYLDESEIKINKYPTNGRITLYAIWKPIKYSIEFDSNGGNGTMQKMENLSYGTLYKLNTNMFTKEGYTFVGWTNSKTSSIIRYFDKQSISNLLTEDGQVLKLYAIWEKNEYSIKFNIDGKITDVKVSYNNKLNEPKAPTKTGYTFMGWYDQKTNQKYDFNNQVKNSFILIAKWKINSYNVILNENGGNKNNTSSIKVNYNETKILPANTYTKNGYEFIGWATNPSGVVVYKNNSSIKNLSSKDNDTVVLYAQWKIIKKDFNVKVENKNIIYNGKAQTINLSNIPSGTKIEYRTSKTGKWTTTKPIRTSVGTTTVYYRITKENYNTLEGSGTITIKPKQIKNLNIGNIGNKTYTGKQIKPTVTVKDGNMVLKNGTNYILSYGTNKNTGKAYVKITGKGNYEGTVIKYFNIVPKAPTISILSGKGSLTITSKSTGASGYEISYSTSKNGKYKIINSSTQKKTISKLTRGRNYYVKVRAYKIIDGKKVYSSYTNIRIIKTK